jgi:hypothetical protein
MKKTNIFANFTQICAECHEPFNSWTIYERNEVEQNQKTGRSLTTKYLMEKRSCTGCGRTQIRDVEILHHLQKGTPA